MLLTTRKYLALVAAVAMTSALGSGCSASADKKEAKAAGVKIAVQAGAVQADVQSIRLTVTDNGTQPAFAPLTTLLSKAPAGNVWTGSLTAIPANTVSGETRRFTAEAYNQPSAGGVKLYEGSVAAAVVAGSVASVTIILQELNVAPGPTNFAPAITALTATNTFGLPGQSGVFSVTAADPDNNGNPLAYQWSAACSSGSLLLGSPTATTTSFTMPGVNATCTVAIKVTETLIAQPLSVTTYFTVSANNNFGDADLLAFPNSFPIITVRGDFRYNYFADVTTIPVGQQGDLFFSAIDPDGDNVRFDLSAKCGADLAAAAASPDLAATFFSEVTRTTTGGAVVPPAPSSFVWTPTFGHPAPVAVYATPDHDCTFRVDVKDLCTGGNCGAAALDGSDKVTTIGATTVTSLTTGLINTTHPARAKRAPAIVRVSAPNQDGPAVTGVQTWDPKRAAIVLPATQYLLQAEADDRYEGGTLLPAWNCANGTVVAPGPVHTGNLSTSALWTSPASLTAGMQCTVTFTSVGATGSGLSTVATFKFASSDPCVGQADGTACSDGSLCTTGETCQAGVCTVPVGGTTTCGASDQCHVAGICDPLSGTCSNPNAANNTACNADSSGCTQNDTCQAGTCTAGAAPACNSAPNSFCFSPAGTCASTGNTTFTCSYAATPGVACSAADATTRCNGADQFTAFACDAVGACLGSGAAACANTTCAAGNSCQPATGACAGGTPTLAGTPCTDGDACTAGDACNGSGACVAAGPTCPGQGCTPGTGVCTSTQVVPQRVLALRLTPPAGATVDGAGNTYVAGGIAVVTPTNFQTRAGGLPALNLNSQGGADAFLAKYDAAGDVTWAITIQDNNPVAITDQAFTLTAVNQAGTVAAVGKFAGAVSFGASTVGGANPTPLIAGLSGATGAKLWASAYDLGANGLFQAITSNPAQASNRFAACGFADTAATTLVPGAVFGGIQDAVVGAWDNAGTKLWARQLGGAAGSNTTESCAAVAVDNNGDVVAAGQFDGATLDLGNGFVLTGPGIGTRKFLWIARFDGATGATLAATAFSGTTGNAVPRSLAIELGGNVAVGGSFTGNVTIGGLLTSTGSEDGFVALLSPAFAPVWNAVRIGGTALDLVRSVDFTGAGDLVAVGNFAASSAAFRTTNGADTTGIAGLTSTGGADAMVLKVNGLTGATDGAAGYGNAGTQSGDTMSANAVSAGNQLTFTATSGGSVTFGTQSFTAAGATDAAVVFSTIQ